MKRMKIVSGIVLAAMFALALAGCPQPDGETLNGEAKLTGITAAGTEVSAVPAPVSQQEWDGADFDLALLEENQTGQVVVDLESKLASAEVTVRASAGAAVKYAAATVDKPSAFGPSPLALTKGGYLCIQVTSQDKKTVNYYVVDIQVANAVVTLVDIKVAGVTVEGGTPNRDYTQAQAGHVVLENTQNVNAQVTVTKGNSGQTLEYAKVEAANSAGAPVFGTGDTFTFADGDILYIQVTAANRADKNIYKILIENDRAQRPEITAQPSNASFEKDQTDVSPLSITATGTGSLSYQWYSNTENSSAGGTLVTGATGAEFTPPVNALGKVYYYAVVTNTDTNVGGQQTASVTSETARVWVVEELEKVEKIVAGGSCTPAYRFTLPEGAKWSDYAKITFKVLVDDMPTINMAYTRAHIVGNYPAGNFNSGTGIYTRGSNWHYARLVTISNSGAMSNILGTDYQVSTWKTLEYSIAKDNPLVDSAYENGGEESYYPAADDIGPFYLGIGLSVNPNNDKTGFVTYYVKDMALVSADGTKTAPADDLTAAFSTSVQVGQIWCKFSAAEEILNSKVERSIVPNPVPVED